MALSYELAPIPKWYFADLTGKPLGAGYMLAFSSLNHAVQKLVYTDATGTTPWNSPSLPKILFDLNGSQGPFYWETNPNDVNDLYFLEVYDLNGVWQFSIDKYGPPNEGNGGGTSTQNGLQNLVVNSVMNNNFGASANPIASTSFVIAPGAHAGLVTSTSEYGPDIQFKKSNLSATDQLEFLPFTLGSTELTRDITPAQYLRYTCTAAGTETFKYVQFPITQNVQNLSGDTVTISIWARCNSGATTLKISVAQFFGDGVTPTPSPTVISTAQTYTLTSAWQKLKVTYTIASVSGKVLGSGGNDGLFLQVNYPLAATTSVDFTKLNMYTGDVTPTEQYTPYDMTDAVIYAPRTGDVKPQYSAYIPFGYLAMDDGTIGNTGSAATSLKSPTAFPLYATLWNDTADAQCPVSTGRGASAIADWEALKTINLPLTSSRALANAIGYAPLAFTEGASSTSDVPNHTHPFSSDGVDFWKTGADHGVDGGGTFSFDESIVTGTTGDNNGGVASISLIQPTTYSNFIIKL